MTRTAHRAGIALIISMLAATVVASTSSPAVAEPSNGYATWQVSSTATGYSGSVTLPEGFPVASFTSTSRVVGSTPIQTGSSVWLPTGTSFGDTFGSSQGKPYINLRPVADNAAPTSSSATVYDFAAPTPVGTWGIGLGDIDAESITVTALDADGAPVSATDLGIQPAFNYCDASPRSSSCSGQTTPYILPTINASGTEVRVEDSACPTISARCDTTGTAVWLSPLVPITSLTVTSTWKQGFPSYQTWFATNSRTIAGTVGLDCDPTQPVDVQLLDGDGLVVASGPVVGGAFSFDGVAAWPDYTLRVDPMSLAANATSSALAVDTSTTDSMANQLIITSHYTARGSVTGQAASIVGVSIELRPAENTAVVDTVTTDVSGSYSFENLVNGDYVARVAVSPDTSIVPAEIVFAVGCADVTLPGFSLTTDAATPDPPVDSGPDEPVAGGADPESGAETLPAMGAETVPVLTTAVLLVTLGALLLAGLSRYRRL